MAPTDQKSASFERSGWPSVSCVIPCRNEAANLRKLIPMLCGVLTRIGSEWEIILVDDGSTDESTRVFDQWCEVPGVVALRLSRNFGKEAALSAGLAQAHGDVVVMLDADMQHPPLLIPEMVDKWQRGADVVYAVRENRDDESTFKRVGSSFFYSLLNMKTRVRIPPNAGDFRLMDRQVVAAILAMPERNRFMKGIYAWVGFQTAAIPYTPAERSSGESHYGVLKLIGLSFDGLTAFTTWPLRALAIFGAALALPAFAYGGYLALSYLLYHNDVNGWTTIVVTLMLFLGIQMISIGIVGEYIGRIYDEVKQRPLYIVKSRLGSGLKAPT